MAVINVQDEGAVGDGTTDDTGAIKNAISIAGEGDTIYFPATNDYYAVEGEGSILKHDISAGNPQDITYEGDGSGSVIKYNGGNNGNGVIVFDVEGGPSSFTMRNMVIDGGKENVSSAPWFNIIDVGDGDAGNQNYIFEDLIIQDSFGEGIHLYVQETLIDRCTISNCERHGVAFAPSSDQVNIPANEIKNTLIEGNGFEGGYYGVDHARGDFLLEDVVIYNNYRGCKTSTDGSNPHIDGRHRRTRIRGNQEHSYLNTEPNNVDRSGNVVFEDVVVEENGKFFRLTEIDYTIEPNSELVVTNNQEADNFPAIMVDDYATFDASSATVWSNNNASYGLTCDGNTKSATIDVYNHFNNVSGPILNSTNLTINSQVNSEKNDISTVPTINDVGAFTTSGPVDVEDNFGTDFTEYASGSKPSDWTSQWHSADTDWNVVSQSSQIGDQYLELNSSDADRRSLSWDVVGDAYNVDMLALAKFPSFTTNDSWGRLICRASGGTTDETAYFSNIRYNQDGGVYQLAINKYVSGSASVIDTVDITDISGSWIWYRFRVENDNLQLRYWNVGEAEPSVWDLNLIDSELSNTGWVGVGGFPPDSQQWDYVGVGIGGLNAPYPDVLGESGTHLFQTLNNASRRTVDGVVQTRPEALNVQTDSATNIGQTESTLNGELTEFDAYYNTDLFFEYMQSGGSTWTETSPRETVSSTGTYNFVLSGLTNGTTYDFRAVTETHGDVDLDTGNTVSFTTIVGDAFNVDTLSSSNVGSSSATLKGELTQLQGYSSVDASFQWRQTGSSTWNQTTAQTLSSVQTYNDSISGLSASTEYEFRAYGVAPDSATDTGSTQTFTTTSTEQIIDSWEDGNALDEYTIAAGSSTNFTVENETNLSFSAIHGTEVLRLGNNFGTTEQTAISTSGLNNYISKGDIAHIYIRGNSSASPHGYIYFGAADGSNYYKIRVEISNDNLALDKNEAGSENNLDFVGASTINENTWYRLVITWDDGTLGGSDNEITAELQSQDGNTSLGSVSAIDSTHATNTGIGIGGQYSASTNRDMFFDMFNIQ